MATTTYRYVREDGEWAEISERGYRARVRCTEGWRNVTDQEPVSSLELTNRLLDLVMAGWRFVEAE